MTTLIAVYTNDGCEGRCDAKCYEAHEPDCHCVCGGLNHGAGLIKATENTRELFGVMLSEYAKSNQVTYEKVIIPDEVLQIPMPFKREAQCKPLSHSLFQLSS